ncbi:hypothetical protein BA895_06105 [Humibacillus sp. DSM 29435]|uniref:hypothetical protein n=1 Tax=Humibacillus sp. DSM 29435 TaxID=1869167 RepID=UPI00087349FD|nr:hypothetical protein [Humibacillus sp. DSM 29435]OFE15310.1 hypothetical protein BA895_06105 [Humibacillus sp. DSM 29435]
MTNTAETDVRAALTEAATMSGLGFDEAAVLSQGHRLVRRRRVATAGAGVVALALAAVVAVQVSGQGFNRALPASPNPTSTVISLAGPIDEAAEVTQETGDGTASGYGTRLLVKGGAGSSRVVETWTVKKAGKTVKTLTRESDRLGVGQASLLFPAESGIPGLVLGYVNTGSDHSSITGVATAPDLVRGAASSESLKTLVYGPQRQDYVFVQTIDAFDPSQIVGLTWLEGAPPQKEGIRAILLNTTRTDLVTVVLTEPGGDQWISWSSDTQIGLAVTNGEGRPTDVTGVVRLLGRPAVYDPELAQHDKIFGWVTGDDTTTVTAITTPPDAAVTTYGPAQAGRRPFLITSKAGRFTGPVKVNGSGGTQTIVRAPGNASP